jgi:UrcA family protein
MLFRTITAAALFTLGLSAAHAEDGIATTLVAYGDLNLSQPADAKMLADRLQVAAKSVCLQANPAIAQSDMEVCADTAISIAMGRIETSLDQKVHASLGNVRISME